MSNTISFNTPSEAIDPSRILQWLESGHLASHAFDHRAHLFAAWSALRLHGWRQGAQRFRDCLRAYLQHLDAPHQYHVTITEAMLRLIAAELLPGKSSATGWQCAWQSDWRRFEREAKDLFHSGREALAPYYSAALIESAQARAEFVPPDLQPLPEGVAG